MQNAAKPAPRNLSGGAWLLADMSLNIWALTIVKALGLGYPAAQIVFLRACIGLLLMLPWAWYARRSFAHIDRWHLHGFRVLFSTLALTTSFFAISRLPFALVTAISFTRPIITMIMAVFFLKEVVAGRRWIAAAIAFIGVLIAVEPGTLPFTWGLPAMFLTVLFGTSAIILTRKLSGTPTVVMMVFYTAGLTLLTAPLAFYFWTPITSEHLLPLLAIGAFSQCAQFCFLQAHGRAEAGFLAILGYLSLLLTTAIGYFVFDEVPSITFAIGAALIVASAIWTTLSRPRPSETRTRV
ncbi:DMT family transporter [Ahrensia marina]|uniref:Membrane protein n=1 Tax=Ahrensia marina TaxID=1514904 RepID=A0A0M9GMM0_9HYPH|nr:DMT family transporter [Ahrensia marina]KPB01016.1 membrane protein [Ahrensia marina]